ncbi:PREDICTED: uncharacterized protein LOC106900525 isoform X1 [Calidris pugnax]|uniref:uncharacterized protein LOC106900525 isoform X1 n=1 Tax=Calidris pugnax TaxID=198806 RepID=UPI00071E4A8C|nr:PREDICTED: uncharacterized protein LOC106900525 isoform X1 [Calidris pugnax]
MDILKKMHALHVMAQEAVQEVAFPEEHSNSLPVPGGATEAMPGTPLQLQRSGWKPAVTPSTQKNRPAALTPQEPQPNTRSCLSSMRHRHGHPPRSPLALTAQNPQLVLRVFQCSCRDRSHQGLYTQQLRLRRLTQGAPLGSPTPCRVGDQTLARSAMPLALAATPRSARGSLGVTASPAGHCSPGGLSSGRGWPGWPGSSSPLPMQWLVPPLLEGCLTIAHHCLPRDRDAVLRS